MYCNVSDDYCVIAGLPHIQNVTHPQGKEILFFCLKVLQPTPGVRAQSTARAYFESPRSTKVQLRLIMPRDAGPERARFGGESGLITETSHSIRLLDVSVLQFQIRWQSIP